MEENYITRTTKIMKHILNTNQDLDFTKFPLFFGNSDGL